MMSLVCLRLSSSVRVLLECSLLNLPHIYECVLCEDCVLLISKKLVYSV